MSKEKLELNENDKVLFRVKSIRKVLGLATKASFKKAEAIFPGLTKHEFLSGLILAQIDTISSILGMESLPKDLIIDVVIEMFKDLKDAACDD